MAPASGVHYHHEDFPETLRLLAEIVARRGGEVPGVERTTHGAWIDWEDLELEGKWSTSERGVVMMLHGLSIIEGAHGAGPLADSISDAVGRIV